MYIFNSEQQKSRSLNIITGFQVMDGLIHIFVLEGLKEHAVRIMWDSLPKPENSGMLSLLTKC